MESSLHEVSTSAESWSDTVRAYMENYKAWLPEVAIYSIAAFTVGFLCKNFGRYIIASLVVAFATVAVLQYAGVITASFQQISYALGITGASSFQELLDTRVAWIQQHPITAVAAIVGFLLGWHIG